MKLLRKNIARKSYAAYPGAKEGKPYYEYYWGRIRLPRFLGKFLWER